MNGGTDWDALWTELEKMLARETEGVGGALGGIAGAGAELGISTAERPTMLSTIGSMMPPAPSPAPSSRAPVNFGGVSIAPAGGGDIFGTSPYEPKKPATSYYMAPAGQGEPTRPTYLQWGRPLDKYDVAALRKKYGGRAMTKKQLYELETNPEAQAAWFKEHAPKGDEVPSFEEWKKKTTFHGLTALRRRYDDENLTDKEIYEMETRPSAKRAWEAGREMQKSQAEAKRVNIERFEDILAGLLERKESVLGGIKGAGEAERQRIAKTSQERQAQVRQGIISAGLGSTTVPWQQTAGVQRQEDVAMSDLAERMSRMFAGVEAGLTGDILGFKERREDEYPDTGIYSLLRQYGAGGGV